MKFLSKVKNKILILYISYQIDIIINHGYDDRNVICKNNIGGREVELHTLFTKTDIVGVTFFCSFPSTAHGALTNHACMSFIAISTCNLVAWQLLINQEAEGCVQKMISILILWKLCHTCATLLQFMSSYVCVGPN